MSTCAPVKKKAMLMLMMMLMLMLMLTRKVHLVVYHFLLSLLAMNCLSWNSVRVRTLAQATISLPVVVVVVGKWSVFVSKEKVANCPDQG